MFRALSEELMSLARVQFIITLVIFLICMIFLLQQMTVTKYMDIQMFLHPPKSSISHCPSGKAPDNKPRPIPYLCKMRRYYTSHQCDKAKHQSRQYATLHVIKIIHENNLRIHQKQDKIS